MIYGYGDSATNYDFYAYNAAGQVWNPLALPSPAFVAWNDADYASYRIAATQQGTSRRFVASEPADTASYAMRVRGASLVASDVAWEGTVVAAGSAPTAEEVADAVVERTLGGGANLVTVTAEDEDGEPLSGVLFRARLNSSVQAEGVTDNDGLVEFALDNGTYKLYGERTGYDSSGLIDLVVSGDTVADPYVLTTQTPATTDIPGTVEFKVPLGKMLVAQRDVAVFIKIDRGDVEIIDLGGQIQYRENSSVKTDAQGYATFVGPTKATLLAAGLPGRYLASTQADFIPEGSWFEVTGPGVVELHDPD